MKTLVVGDTHMEWGKLNALINKTKPELILQVGDFGFWPNIGWGKPVSNIKLNGSILRWCDGNHEDHWALKDRKTDELSPGIIYMPRGSTYELPDGRTILFMGGANSIDKNIRTIGRDWFPEETISYKDIENLPDKEINIVISHTCPNEFLPEVLGLNPYKDKDPSYEALSVVLNKYHPKLWFFGHFHYYKTGLYKDCQWHCIGALNFMTRWWMWLPQ
jgi:hypothetical protein